MPTVYMYFKGCDDAQIKIWEIPEGGLTEPLTEPVRKLHGKSDFSFLLSSFFQRMVITF